VYDVRIVWGSARVEAVTAEPWWSVTLTLSGNSDEVWYKAAEKLASERGEESGRRWRLGISSTGFLADLEVRLYAPDAINEIREELDDLVKKANEVAQRDADEAEKQRSEQETRERARHEQARRIQDSLRSVTSPDN
jgi:hypothetical protein